jgi:hypothetical protein
MDCVVVVEDMIGSMRSHERVAFVTFCDLCYTSGFLWTGWVSYDLQNSEDLAVLPTVPIVFKMIDRANHRILITLLHHDLRKC